MSADDADTEWPEPNPNPHLTPLRTTAQIVDTHLPLSPADWVGVIVAIIAVQTARVALGAPPLAAAAKSLLTAIMALCLGVAVRRATEAI